MIYKNIVFDVGDVLVDFCYEKLMRNLGFSEEAVEFLSANMVVTEYWHELDLGKWTGKDALPHFLELYPQYEKEIRAFWANTDKLIEEYPYSEPMVKRLKDAGYGVYILSNYPTDTAEQHWPTFKFLPLADGYIISGFEKITKPDAEIYRLLESRFGIKLSESLFVDDRQVNIDGAKAVGMDAVLFTGYENLVQAFHEKGIQY